jgi:hypothetical protein
VSEPSGAGPQNWLEALTEHGMVALLGEDIRGGQVGSSFILGARCCLQTSFDQPSLGQFLVNWLASPLGNLLWDLVLIVATVALIPLVLALLEKLRTVYWVRRFDVLTDSVLILLSHPARWPSRTTLTNKPSSSMKPVSYTCIATTRSRGQPYGLAVRQSIFQDKLQPILPCY